MQLWWGQAAQDQPLSARAQLEQPVLPEPTQLHWDTRRLVVEEVMGSVRPQHPEARAAAAAIPQTELPLGRVIM
jgi:hypothetical protein